MSEEVEWFVEIVDGIDIPGWFLIPESADLEQQELWVGQNAEELKMLVGSNRWDGEPTTASDIEDILRLAFVERETTDSDALFQVWPMPFPATVLCHLNLVTSSTLPVWSEVGGIVYPVEAPHLGAGVQVSTRRTEDDVDLVSVHLVFSNGDVALMLSLEEAPAPLIARIEPEFMLMSEAVRLQSSDGAQFVGILPDGQLPEEAPWQFEEVEPA